MKSYSKKFECFATRFAIAKCRGELGSRLETRKLFQEEIPIRYRDTPTIFSPCASNEEQSKEEGKEVDSDDVPREQLNLSTYTGNV